MVILQLAIAIFGNSYWPHGSIVVFSSIWFALLLTRFTWSQLSKQKRQLLGILLNWILLGIIVVFFLHRRCHVNSLYDALIVWHHIVDNIQQLCLNILIFTIVHIQKLIQKTIAPAAVIFSAILPVFPVLYDGHMAQQIMSKQTHRVVSFLA
jgi:hypothetical protein